jgi:hypothetical protein
MDLPVTLEECHQTIRDLVEENEALRKAGDDFGHLAERLSLALREERRRSGDQQPRTLVRQALVCRAPAGQYGHAGADTLSNR